MARAWSLTYKRSVWRGLAGSGSKSVLAAAAVAGALVHALVAGALACGAVSAGTTPPTAGPAGPSQGDGVGGGSASLAGPSPGAGAGAGNAWLAGPSPGDGVGGGSAAPAACDDRGAVELVDHAIDLSLGFEPPSLSGRGDVRVRAVRAVAAVVLDAHALRVSEASVAGVAARFRQHERALCVELPSPVAAGAEISLHLAWQVPVDGSVPRFVGREVWAGYDAAAWMPTRQDPAARATLSLRVTAPSDAKVAGPGRAARRQQAVGVGPSGEPSGVGPSGEGPSGEAGGVGPSGAAEQRRTVHVFALERPSPPFLYAFAAGRFEEATLAVDGVTLRALGPAGADLAGVLARTAPMLRFLREHTGAPLPVAEYTQVFVDGDAAQEGAGLALIGASALDELRDDPHEDWIFAHELSHQWFAWLVPCADFADFWLNEGFATFATGAIKEARWGRAAYDRELGLWRQRSDKVHAAGRDAPLSLSPPGAPARRPPREEELQPRGVTYARGALVLDALRLVLGDQPFWDGVRRYVADRAGKGARSEDLRRALEAASGVDLGSFFEERVYAAAPPP